MQTLPGGTSTWPHSRGAKGKGRNKGVVAMFLISSRSSQPASAALLPLLRVSVVDWRGLGQDHLGTGWRWRVDAIGPNAHQERGWMRTGEGMISQKWFYKYTQSLTLCSSESSSHYSNFDFLFLLESITLMSAVWSLLTPLDKVLLFTVAH